VSLFLVGDSALLLSSEIVVIDAVSREEIEREERSPSSDDTVVGTVVIVVVEEDLDGADATLMGSDAGRAWRGIETSNVSSESSRKVAIIAHSKPC
jgi:hypothetical protein